MKRRIEVVSIVIALLGMLMVGICFSGPAPGTTLEKELYQAALKEGRMDWWDSLSLKESAVFIKEFGNKYPGIKIDYFEATTDVREEKYLAEYSAGRKTLDCTSIDLYDKFKEKNLLLNMGDIIKDVKYPQQFCTKDLMGATLEHLMVGAAYNTKLVPAKDIPRSWEDLLNPKWKGKVNVEQRFKFFIYNTPNWGQERTVNYLKKLRELKPTFTKGDTQTATLLSTGEFSISVGLYLHRIILQKSKDDPVDWLPFNPIVHKLSPYVIMREAPHPNAAKLFFRWWMSPEGQLLTDKVRLKGNPLPGSQTNQSKMIEKMGLEIFSCPAWEVEGVTGIEDLYAEAVGLTKK